MTIRQTYQGVVREGNIYLSPATELPEGSHVYVVVAGPDPLLDERLARRKAIRWLVDYVGNMLVAGEGHLLESNGRIVWRFGAFITGRGHRLRGPIGYTDVDAHSGDILATEQQADEMLAHGETFVRSLLQAK